MPRDRALRNSATRMCCARLRSRTGSPVSSQHGPRLGYRRIRHAATLDHTRTDREASRGKQGGRTLEIQRLIGRALRSVTDLEALGEHQVKLDCDVLQADGGTRTAAITGAWVALRIATEKMLLAGGITRQPVRENVAAISCGIWQGMPVADLDYIEDSNAEIDANFVLSGNGGLVEFRQRARNVRSGGTSWTSFSTLPRRAASSCSHCRTAPFAPRSSPGPETRMASPHRIFTETDLVLASHNAGKLREISALFEGRPFQVTSAADHDVRNPRRQRTALSAMPF